MPRIDAMQVCVNGHYITDRYHTLKHRRENYCTKCGAKTIIECQNCGAEIPGEDLDSSVGFAAPPTPPEYCRECGSPFPWTNVEPPEQIDIIEALSIGESEIVEFKQELPDTIRDISKEIVALSNHRGGSLFIGISDDGEVVGLTDAGDTEERVTGAINDHIEPTIRPMIEIVTHDGNDVLAIHVPQAEDKPFSLDGSFYIRSGTIVETMSSDDLEGWF